MMTVESFLYAVTLISIDFALYWKRADQWEKFECRWIDSKDINFKGLVEIEELTTGEVIEEGIERIETRHSLSIGFYSHKAQTER